jgi:hypothetical protein
MKLSCIDLYLKMTVTMKEVEDETVREQQVEQFTSIASTPQEGDEKHPASPAVDNERNPPMSPLNEIAVGEDVVESQLMSTQI